MISIMYSIINCNLSEEYIASFWLLESENIMGAIILYPFKKNKVILEIFIEDKYANKWLFKNFANSIKETIVKFAQSKNIEEICTKANNLKSPRLLDFFGFKAYNNVYYKLII